MTSAYDTYLDDCPEVEDACKVCGLTDKEHCDPSFTGDKVTRHFFDPVGPCEGCPVGGGLECPGEWRWKGSEKIVTQEERESDSWWG